MLKFMMIPNMERFLSLIEESHGKVILHLPDDTQCDLKQDRTARQLIRTMNPGRDGLCISLTDPDDTPAFIDYMISAAHKPSAFGRQV